MTCRLAFGWFQAIPGKVGCDCALRPLDILNPKGKRGIKPYFVFSFRNFPHEDRDDRKLCGKASPLMEWSLRKESMPERICLPLSSNQNSASYINKLSICCQDLHGKVFLARYTLVPPFDLLSQMGSHDMSKFTGQFQHPFCGNFRKASATATRTEQRLGEDAG